ncbi:MAG: choice-of-anchor L domain-containing protein, partial [Bacteroidota bacterium]|nr:choice-of-anchor L domain-containing protein [Bacteroidota bacterium]
MKNLLFFICLLYYGHILGQTTGLQVTKTSPNTTFEVNSTVTFTITISNSGPSTNITVVDNVPVGTTNMQWYRGFFEAFGYGSINETLPIANGETIVYQIELYIPPTYNPNVTVTNTVTVSSNNQTVTATATINPAPNYVTIDTTHSIDYLVENVLLKNVCPGLVYNINSSTCSPGSTASGIGYFSNNNSNFPMEKGIIIRNGDANLSQGPYTGVDFSSSCSGTGATDSFLQNLANQVQPGGNIQDVTFLEFDFVPMKDELSFDFLFSSNEYGPFQCTFSDVFGFQLTNLVTGVSENLAVIPGTNTPVSVGSIRDSQYNSSCASANPQYFASFNDPNYTPNAPINMRGHTIPMTASAEVVPCTPYRIRFAVGDFNDNQFDTAVFLLAGSFDIGDVDLGDNHLISNGMAICPNESITLDTGLTNSSGCINFDFQWYKDGNPINGATSPTLEVSNPEQGMFSVTITASVTLDNSQIICHLPQGQIIIESEIINTSSLSNKSQCTNTFDLTEQETAMMVGIPNPADYEISYYNTSLQDAQNGANPINFQSTNNNIHAYQVAVGQTQTIYVRVENVGTGCAKIESFTLTVLDCQITTPDDVAVCDNDQNGNEVFNLSDFDAGILSGLTGFDVSYHLTQNDADNGTNPITNTAAPNGPTISVNTGITQQIWFRASEVANPNASIVDSFNLTVHAIPNLNTAITDYLLCEQNGDGQEVFD